MGSSAWDDREAFSGSQSARNGYLGNQEGTSVWGTASREGGLLTMTNGREDWSERNPRRVVSKVITVCKSQIKVVK